MAWIEDEPWEMEQGKDGLLSLELYSNDAATEAWPFTGWDVNATVSDAKGRTVYSVTVNAFPASGKLDLIFPEALVNSLKVSKTYRYDCLMVAPGNVQADDHFVATGPVVVGLRTSRRDAT